MKHGPSHNTPNNRQRPTSQQQNRKRKSKNSKTARGQSIQRVLCVNTELCANAGGEVRGNLEDSVVIA